MTDTPDDTAPSFGITDPAFRDAVADLGPTVMIMEPRGHVAFADVQHLDDDKEAWQEFLGEAVGGGYTATHKYRDKGLSLYFDSSAAPDPDRFNPLATMVMAQLGNVPFDQADMVFGAMVMTGYDFDAWVPRALDGDGRNTGLDAAITSDQRAKEVLDQLNDPESRGPRL